jgi:hypothetical protein
MLYALHTGLTGRTGRYRGRRRRSREPDLRRQRLRLPAHRSGRASWRRKRFGYRIYLPRWFACKLPAIHAPLILLAASPNGRNIPARHLVALAGQDPRLMAGSWLRAHGLISAGVRSGE